MESVRDIENNPRGENHLNLFDLQPGKVFKYRFDFEIGHLVKSPCRECHGCSGLPDCADDCAIIEKIQTILAESVSCTRRTY